MIVVLVKEESGTIYSTSSFNEKLEKEVKSKPEDNSLLMKHLGKEFEISSSSIHKFWIVNE